MPLQLRKLTKKNYFEKKSYVMKIIKPINFTVYGIRINMHSTRTKITFSTL